MDGNFSNTRQMSQDMKAQETKERGMAMKAGHKFLCPALRKRLTPYFCLLGLAMILTKEELCENQMVTTLAVVAAALNIFFLIENKIKK